MWGQKNSFLEIGACKLSSWLHNIKSYNFNMLNYDIDLLTLEVHGHCCSVLPQFDFWWCMRNVGSHKWCNRGPRNKIKYSMQPISISKLKTSKQELEALWNVVLFCINVATWIVCQCVWLQKWMWWEKTRPYLKFSVSWVMEFLL